MEKFNYFEENRDESKQEKISPIKEKLEKTNKILQRLILWGFMSFSPMVATEIKAQELELKNPETIENTNPEKDLVEQGLVGKLEKHKKPVVAVMSRDKEESGQHHNILSSFTEANLVNDDKVDVVSRDPLVIKEILREHHLVEEGLVKPENSFRLGNFENADYYVLSSTQNIDGVQTLTNKIIRIEDGAISVVSVKTKKEYAESAVQELTEKTEKAVEKLELDKK